LGNQINLVISLSFLVFFLLTSNVNSSPNWVKYLNDKDGNICSYKKVNSNKDNGNYIVQVWTKIVLSEKRREEIIQKRIELGISTNQGRRGQVFAWLMLEKNILSSEETVS